MVLWPIHSMIIISNLEQKRATQQLISKVSIVPQLKISFESLCKQSRGQKILPYTMAVVSSTNPSNYRMIFQALTSGYNRTILPLNASTW